MIGLRRNSIKLVSLRKALLITINVIDGAFIMECKGSVENESYYFKRVGS